jgi:hypothetical protein
MTVLCIVKSKNRDIACNRIQDEKEQEPSSEEETRMQHRMQQC